MTFMDVECGINRVRGKTLYHKIRTECAGWTFDMYREWRGKKPGERGEMTIAESECPEYLVTTEFVWDAHRWWFEVNMYFDDDLRDGEENKVEYRTFDDAIADHNIRAAGIIAQLNDIDAVIEQGAAPVLMDGWL